jgi:hypothetical protein
VCNDSVPTSTGIVAFFERNRKYWNASPRQQQRQQCECFRSKCIEILSIFCTLCSRIISGRLCLFENHGYVERRAIHGGDCRCFCICSSAAITVKASAGVTVSTVPADFDAEFKFGRNTIAFSTVFCLVDTCSFTRIRKLQ